MRATLVHEPRLAEFPRFRKALAGCAAAVKQAETSTRNGEDRRGEPGPNPDEDGASGIHGANPISCNGVKHV
jgi:hypothetical protein